MARCEPNGGGMQRVLRPVLLLSLQHTGHHRCQEARRWTADVTEVASRWLWIRKGGFDWYCLDTSWDLINTSWVAGRGCPIFDT